MKNGFGGSTRKWLGAGCWLALLLLASGVPPDAFRTAAEATTSGIEVEVSQVEQWIVTAPAKPLRSEALLVAVLKSTAPRAEKKEALLELAELARAAGQAPKAQQLYSIFVRQFPDDPALPSILLQQGLLYREMGASTQALTKFYAVMTTALNLETARLDGYKQLVLQAQAEIAETYYRQGQHVEAGEFYRRLLRIPGMEPRQAEFRYKLLRSASALDQPQETAALARQFLDLHPGLPEVPEARFLLAQALKKMGRKEEYLEQVMLLLQSQQAAASQDPARWLYWQRRTGNDIARQLFEEGDYASCLQIYLNLVTLDGAPGWKIPVLYQTGLVYERLLQPEKAAEMYHAMAQLEQDLQQEEASLSLKSMVDMARWRLNHLRWEQEARRASLASPP